METYREGKVDASHVSTQKFGNLLPRTSRYSTAKRYGDVVTLMWQRKRVMIQDLWNTQHRRVTSLKV
jgi:hypothetical protein